MASSVAGPWRTTAVGLPRMDTNTGGVGATAYTGGAGGPELQGVCAGATDAAPAPNTRIERTGKRFIGDFTLRPGGLRGTRPPGGRDPLPSHERPEPSTQDRGSVAPPGSIRQRP